MTQRIPPYWVGNVARLHIPHIYFRAEPIEVAGKTGLPSSKQRLADVLPLIRHHESLPDCE